MSADSSWHPRLPAGAVLRHDPTRKTDVLLLPERVIVLHGSARAVLDLCDGTHSTDEIAGLLTTDAPESVVRGEVAPFLNRLRTEGCLL